MRDSFGSETKASTSPSKQAAQTCALSGALSVAPLHVREHLKGVPPKRGKFSWELTRMWHCESKEKAPNGDACEKDLVVKLMWIYDIYIRSVA